MWQTLKNGGLWIAGNFYYCRKIHLFCNNQKERFKVDAEYSHELCKR